MHLAIIPDGNRRWARARGLVPTEGHRIASERLFDLAEAAADRGVEHLTLYVFSTENWRRARDEVGFLLGLFGKFLTMEIKKLHRAGFRVRFFGSREGIALSLLRDMDAAVELTKDNNRATINLCFNYGGRRDLVEAVAEIVRSGVPAEEVNEAVIAEHLSTHGTPPPDMVIRTSGEQRLSNFLLWEANYAELMFFDLFWPDFGEAQIDEALAEYARRKRRYGA